MRHHRVAVNTATRDARLRCMTVAMDAAPITAPVRIFLDRRFAEVADLCATSTGSRGQMHVPARGQRH